MDFVTNKCSNDYLKLTSVLEDLQDENIVSMIAAVAFFNYLVTKPYWDLMQSDKHSYFDFPPYVKKLKTFFDTAIIDANPVYVELKNEHLKLDVTQYTG